jgi:hypothetical protein
MALGAASWIVFVCLRSTFPLACGYPANLPVDDPVISPVPGAVRPELVRGSGGAVGAITAIGACNISGRRGFIDGPHMHFCVASQLGCLP